MSRSESDKQNLFSEFPPVSREEWEQQIREDLDGADYKKKLRWNTREGIEVLPFYRREDLEGAPVPGPGISRSGTGNNWDIIHPVFAGDPVEAGNRIGHAAAKGADGTWLTVKIRNSDGALGGDISGTSIQGQDDFNSLCSASNPGQTSLHFDSGPATPALLAMFLNYLQEYGSGSATNTHSFLYDPFSHALQHGRFPKPFNEITSDCSSMIAFCDRYLPGTRTLGVDGRLYHKAGGSIVQEVGASLAEASEYLAALTGAGHQPGDIARNIHFVIAFGSNYFLEIAKARALRILWKQLLESYGNETQIPAFIHGQTSGWNKTMYEPYTNLLRTSTEGMSAALAGCDAVTVYPYDATFRRPDEFSSRIARNSQIIFKEEGYLHKVADPAAGSYYIEMLTDKIAEKSWEIFCEIEQQGGILKSIRNGIIQMMINESREEKDQAIALRKRSFVGTNRYPNPEETIKDEIGEGYTASSLQSSGETPEIDAESLIESLAGALKHGVLLGDLVPNLIDSGKHEYTVLRRYRGARPYEEMRLSTEHHAYTPMVMTLPVGNRSKRKARSTFAANFFGSAGYRIMDPIGFDSAGEAVEKVFETNPDIAVICSSDDEYPDLVPYICKKLKEKNDSIPILVLAGYPGDEAESYRDAGIDEFIYSGCDVLELLKKFQSQLGIEQ